MKLVMYAIPKTGTSTVEYNAKRRLPKEASMVVNAREIKGFDDLSNDRLSQLQFVSGHRITRDIIEKMKGLDSSFRAITLFRNPAEQIVSAYNFALNHKLKRKVPFFFWYHFLLPKNPQTSHFVRRFKGQWWKSFFLSKRDLQEVLKEFEVFDEVICTENINTRIPQLFAACGIGEVNEELIRRKETGNHYHTYLTLTDRLQRKLERDNALDVAVYRHFKALGAS